MKKTNLKYYIGIIIIFTIDSLPRIIFENNDKYDIYLFYNHSRYLTNILFDISGLLKFSLLTFWLIRFKKHIFVPLFLLSIYIWLSYFIFYNQIGSIISIPLYVITIIIYNKFYRK
jgi:hypothetical protein